jgi:hypothetical protein
MPFDKFVSLFEYASICMVKDDYKYTSVLLNSENKKSKYMKIKVEVAGKYFI